MNTGTGIINKPVQIIKNAGFLTGITISIKNMWASFLSNAMSNILFLAIIPITVFVVYQVQKASKDPRSSSEHFWDYFATIVLPIIGIFSFIVYNLFEKSVSMALFGGVFAFGFIFVFFYYFLKTELSKYVFNNYLLYGIMGLIIIVGLTLVGTFMGNYLKRMPGTIGFIMNFIFYIPCLLSELFKYLIDDFSKTHDIILLLLFLEMVLILCYVYLVPFLQNQGAGKHEILLNDPVFLSKYTDITQKLKDTKINMIEDPGILETDKAGNTTTNNALTYRKNYAISIWVYLNSVSSTKLAYTAETNIFNFASHPKITYDNTDSKDRCMLYLSASSEPYSIVLEKQKWHNIVFNYNGPQVDIFINGVLERTFTFNNKEMPVFSPYDLMYIGPDNQKDGLYGAVCNIVYHTNMLSRDYIVQLNNFYSFKNPPTIGH